MPVEFEVHVFVTLSKRYDDVEKSEHDIVEHIKDGLYSAYGKHSSDVLVEVVKADLVE